jgi:peptide/nickel transport system substrate-binding protein
MRLLHLGFATAAAGAALLLTVSTPARAQQGPPAAREVTIALAAPPASFDPHYFAHAPSFMVQQHVFESLVWRDERGRTIPALATEWHMLPDGAGWEFRLHPEARFSDGAPVTPADVAATVARLPNVPNSPGRLTIYTQGVRAVEAAGPHAVRLLTDGPAPLLPDNIPPLMIVPERIAREATTQDFNAGRAAIGSGPFRLREYVAGERVVLERNDAFRGPAPAWSRVTFRIIANDSARVAALRAGDVHLIDAVPARDVATLERDPNIAVARSPGTRLIYVLLDVARDASPGVADLEGRPLARNPLKDLRVRRALSLAIDREAIRQRIMEGQSAPAGQLQAIGLGVADPALSPDPFDPAAARRLLAEAGWGNGFRLTFAGPNDRYVNDEKILQAIAQFWERVGIRVRVEAMPSSVFFPRQAQLSFSAALTGWQSSATEPNNIFAPMLLTVDRTRGWGTVNRSGYSNPRLDELYSRAVITMVPEERVAMWREAVRMAMADLPILPIHHQINIWATRRGHAYEARSDEYTLATSLRPAP